MLATWYKVLEKGSGLVLDTGCRLAISAAANMQSAEIGSEVISGFQLAAGRVFGPGGLMLYHWCK